MYGILLSALSLSLPPSLLSLSLSLSLTHTHTHSPTSTHTHTRTRGRMSKALSLSLSRECGKSRHCRAICLQTALQNSAMFLHPPHFSPYFIAGASYTSFFNDTLSRMPDSCFSFLVISVGRMQKAPNVLTVAVLFESNDCAAHADAEQDGHRPPADRRQLEALDVHDAVERFLQRWDCRDGPEIAKSFQSFPQQIQEVQ